MMAAVLAVLHGVHAAGQLCMSALAFAQADVGAAKLSWTPCFRSAEFEIFRLLYHAMIVPYRDINDREILDLATLSLLVSSRTNSPTLDLLAESGAQLELQYRSSYRILDPSYL